MISEGSKNNVLHEAGKILSEPTRDTNRKILLAVNVLFISSLLLFLIVQLINFVTLPDPARDFIFYPLVIAINLASFAYNYRVLEGVKPINLRSDRLSAWATVLIAMVMAIVIVHASINTAMSMLVDFGFSVILLFIVGIVLGRRMAIIWFAISAVSLSIAYFNIGSDFEYHLMTREEVAAYNEALKFQDSDALERQLATENERLVPASILLYFTVWMIFMVFAFMAVYFESNMISRVLNVIPKVIEKINIASEERMQLQEENVRMGMELDVARKIQLMMLPNDFDYSSQKNVTVAARMEPATEIGGDLYEFLPQKDGSVILAIGDVTDHGLQSGLVMLMAQSVLRTVLEDQEVELTDALTRINTVLYRNIRNRLNDVRNLTMVLVRIKDNEVTVCGQHENIFYYNGQTGETKMISTGYLGMYIGLIENVDEYINEVKLPFSEGDLYFFYTDGFTEAENEAGDFFGEDRLFDLFKQLAPKGPDVLLKEMYDELDNFIGDAKILDDITGIAIQCRNSINE